MKRSILVPVLIMLAIVVVAFGQATQNLAGEKNVVVLGGTTNKVVMNPVSAASMTRLATTTMTVITSIASRKTLAIHSLETAANNYTFVSVGESAATASYGIPVTPGNPLIIDVGPDVPVALISTGAYVVTVTQTSQP
jgi:hypothetical protein